MNTLDTLIQNYLSFIKTQRCLDDKTIKAYGIDLNQFLKNIPEKNITNITIETIEMYVAFLHQNYKPKTVKRKIASLKAFYHYLEYKEIIPTSPFNKIRIKFREPTTLPKTIPLYIVETLLRTIYKEYTNAKTNYQQCKILQDVTITELLFSTGMRISELCSLHYSDINLLDNSILIHGKGNKERLIQIGNNDMCKLLQKYYDCYKEKIRKTNYFFVNSSETAISDQSIRRMLRKYSSIAGIKMRITPHMFRHTFATSLLDSDVDIRYIQSILGHSSISITEIYTHVSVAKQLDIMKNKHPRKNFNL